MCACIVVDVNNCMHMRTCGEYVCGHGHACVCML